MGISEYIFFNVFLVLIYLLFIGGIGFLLYYGIMAVALCREKDPMHEVDEHAYQYPEGTNMMEDTTVIYTKPKGNNHVL